MRINWEIFFGNSSTEEAIVYFAKGKYSFKKFIEECWPKECKSSIQVMKYKGYKKCRRNARYALSRRGFKIKDWD